MKITDRIRSLLFAFGLLILFAIGMSINTQSAKSQTPPGDPDKPWHVYLPSISTKAGESTQLGFVQHAGQLIAYTGAASCETCHNQQVQDFAASEHYLWKGKLGVMNDYCGYPDINLGPSKLTTVHGTQVDGGCLTCHAGLGEKPTTSNPHNADCLVCHSTEYRRTLVSTAAGFRFAPDRASMPATITVESEPSRYSCLACHAYAGGGCNNKRGDMSDALVNPSQDVDVHMGGGMTCVDCHQSEGHRIAGRGSDLRIDEGVPMRACTDCHTPNTDHNSTIQRHLNKVACQTCHIPTFANHVSTDMLRDYRSVEVNPKGLYEPKITRQSNVIPAYAFWNGKSGFYNFRDPASAGQAISWPLGNINDGKIFPFKLHQAILPQDPVTRAILPVKSGILFQTGNIDQAIRTGAEQAGFNLTQGYTFVDVKRWMGIFHETPPAINALDCADCHNDGSRLDFSALGYDPKPTRNGRPLCTSCHGSEDNLSFNSLHNLHVREERIACSQCHNFSR